MGVQWALFASITRIGTGCINWKSMLPLLIVEDICSVLKERLKYREGTQWVYLLLLGIVHEDDEVVG